MQPNQIPGEALFPVGKWLAAALDDPSVCAEMKADIEAWFDVAPKVFEALEDLVCQIEWEIEARGYGESEALEIARDTIRKVRGATL